MKYLIVLFALCAAALTAESADFKVTLQDRVPTPTKEDKNAVAVRHRIEEWKGEETAIIIIDMWERINCHHCMGRSKEVAVGINETIKAARKKGIQIIHSPSAAWDDPKKTKYPDTLPCRQKSKEYRTGKGNLTHWDAWVHSSPTEKDRPFPISMRDGGCNDPRCKDMSVISRMQDPTIEILDDDIATDDYEEIIGYCKAKKIKNIIIMGVHTNMCIVGRPFGLRAMVKQGFNTVLVRDLTDLVYNNDLNERPESPHVSHFAGLDLVIAYIESFIAPTISSTELTGKPSRRFKDDLRPRVAFVTGKDEFTASPVVNAAADKLLRAEFHCDFAADAPKDADIIIRIDKTGKPVATFGNPKVQKMLEETTAIK